MPAVAEREKVKSESVLVPAFGIEADHPRNSDLLIQCVPGLRLRSAIDPLKSVKDAKTGEDSVPLDQARDLASFPRVSGMRLIVDPQKLTYKVIDPLAGDEDLERRVTNWIRKRQSIQSDSVIRGCKPKEGTLNKHRMKTLCREMFRLVEAKEAKPVREIGPMPDLEDINELPGEYLLNPGSRVLNTQPRFEKDFDEWYQSKTLSGGADN